MKRQPPILLGRRSPGKRRIRLILLLLLAAVVPPVMPHLLALRHPAAQAQPVDAVMVVTGGEGRIAAGYKAWSTGIGRDLYIFGTGGAVPLSRLLPQTENLPPEAASRIRMEGWSENTLENAYSARTAAQERGYSTVILVTSDYHVPRAYLTFRKVLPPRVALSVLPVPSGGWISPAESWRTARRFFVEGWKYWGYRILLRWE